jgi:Protein of unknown function (DUF3574)
MTTLKFIRSLTLNMLLAISIPAVIAFQSQFALADTAPTVTLEQAPQAETWNRTELYFGMSNPDGTTITEAEFKAFMDESITSRFPDGLTLLTGYGQYLGENGEITKETSKVLVLFYPSDMTNANENIEAIRNEYEKAFQQESVLRVDSLERLSF